MSENPAATAAAAPSNHAAMPRTDAKLLRQFVIEYLQSHGFDKALATFQAGIAEQASGEAGDKDAAGEDDAAAPTGGDGERRGSGGAGAREAMFRAPGPVPLESIVKRNIPQAQALSASTMSDKITPEFEAQARYIIEQLQKKVEASAAADADGDDGTKELKDAPTNQESLLDPSDRVEGYRGFRTWVDGGLDIWQAELDNLSFPLFVHTFLDLINFGFLKSARDFFEKYSSHHRALHPQDISTLASVSMREHVQSNPFCQRILADKYVIPLSRNTNDLLLQWLSGAGLDEDWEAGLHSAAGRAKEAIKGIVFNNISIHVTTTSVPLDKITLASKSGLIASALPSAMPIEAFNTATNLKLGPPPMTDKLKEQIARTLRDEDASQQPNGNISGADANGDVEMASPSQDQQATEDRPKSPTVQEIKLEPETDRDPTLVSPDENETLPPIPAVFRLPDLKREVEAIRDKRKMIRLGPPTEDGKVGSSSQAVLPSVVAFTLFDHGETATSAEFSNDSSLMAVGSSESTIRLWSLKGEKLKKKSVDPLDGSLIEDEGLPMRKLVGHSGPVYSLSFDPIYGSASPPSTMLSSSQDGTVRLWSLDTYSNLVVYRGHGRDPVWDVEWGPMGVYFATASRDRTARLWSSDRVTPLRMYTGHLSDVNCVRFHPNSLYLATGSNDASCRLWDVQRGACVRLFLGHTDAVTTLAVSPDGKLLASAGLDSSIWLWDLGSSRPIKRMTGHGAPVQSLSFSAESSVLVSGGLDATVRCWDVKSAGGEKLAGRSTEGGLFGGGAAIGGTEEQGVLPMGPGQATWEEGTHTADLLATFPTKRTPILKTHYTPRNLCMVAGNFIAPSSGSRATGKSEGTNS
ncbi:transcription initiation factor TFIID subunit 5 [Kwoniella heveanensis CBS 569]|nr:transcription initiation factor TFIID subunit 5 [Kwoniella heveanensis CBS 569]